MKRKLLLLVKNDRLLCDLIEEIEEKLKDLDAEVFEYVG